MDHSIPDPLRTHAQDVLSQIEETFSVQVLYACESGSRAWGFPSQNSDFDLRFLYVRPPGWYLSVKTNRRDVIDDHDLEEPSLALDIREKLDPSGWDLRKALGLLRKSNPSLLEWLRSPIVYREHDLVNRLREDLLPRYYDPSSCHYHYYNMATDNFSRYVEGEEHPQLKKYLYTLRPVLAMRWIETKSGPVPTPFEALIERCIEDEEAEVRRAARRLVDAKQEGRELDRGSRLPALNAFLAAEIERFADAPPEETPVRTVEPLDDYFHTVLRTLYPDWFRA